MVCIDRLELNLSTIFAAIKMIFIHFYTDSITLIRPRYGLYYLYMAQMRTLSPRYGLYTDFITQIRSRYGLYNLDTAQIRTVLPRYGRDTDYITQIRFRYDTITQIWPRYGIYYLYTDTITQIWRRYGLYDLDTAQIRTI